MAYPELQGITFQPEQDQLLLGISLVEEAAKPVIQGISFLESDYNFFLTVTDRFGNAIVNAGVKIISEDYEGGASTDENGQVEMKIRRNVESTILVMMTGYQTYSHVFINDSYDNLNWRITLFRAQTVFHGPHGSYHNTQPYDPENNILM